MRTPSRFSTFRTRETQTGPGALCTPGTAVSAGHRIVRGRRLPPLSGRSLPSRYSHPARNVSVTRHQRGFPGSRPSGPFPSPVAALTGTAAPHPAGQEPATHVTAGTGRTQTRSYVPGISQTSFDQLTHHVRPRVATPLTAGSHRGPRRSRSEGPYPLPRSTAAGCGAGISPPQLRSPRSAQRRQSHGQSSLR